MGCFSWTFSDYGNMKNLCMGESAYLYCPNGTVLFEPKYDGVGEFGGQDVYALVADWNREFLARNPDFKILYKDSNTELLPVSQAFWYPAYADLSKSKEEVIQICKKDGRFDWRLIGICIACYDRQNEALPYPIKIAKRKQWCYEMLLPSHSDPNQGHKWTKSDMQIVATKIYGKSKRLAKNKVSDESSIALILTDEKAEIYAKQYGPSNEELLFSIKFLAKPTASCLNIVPSIARQYVNELKYIKDVFYNRNSKAKYVDNLLKNVDALCKEADAILTEANERAGKLLSEAKRLKEEADSYLK